MAHPPQTHNTNCPHRISELRRFDQHHPPPNLCNKHTQRLHQTTDQRLDNHIQATHTEFDHYDQEIQNLHTAIAKLENQATWCQCDSLDNYPGQKRLHQLSQRIKNLETTIETFTTATTISLLNHTHNATGVTITYNDGQPTQTPTYPPNPE